MVTIVLENGVVKDKTILPTSGGWGATGYSQTSVTGYSGGFRTIAQVQSVSITSVTWTPKTKE